MNVTTIESMEKNFGRTGSEVCLLALQSSIINLQSSIINHQSPIINHQPSTINHQPSIINHQPSNTFETGFKREEESVRRWSVEELEASVWSQPNPLVHPHFFGPRRRMSL